MFFYPALRSLLFYFDAEVAHRITINLLKTYQIKNNFSHPSLSYDVFGLNFTNPVGLAAGFYQPRIWFFGSWYSYPASSVR
jgi:dihydroorotate dehydrogenase